MVIKIDILTDCDRANWLSLRMIFLIRIGFCVSFVNREMSCVASMSLSIPINGSTSTFFRMGRELSKGCPLSPLFFLILAKGLSRALMEAKRTGTFNGIRIGGSLYFI